MRLSTVRNDAGDPTLTIDHFERRHYKIGSALNILACKYDGFYGEVLEVHQCNAYMDEQVASNLICKLAQKYETPDTEVVLASDNGDTTNTHIVEIHVVKVLSYETKTGSMHKLSKNTIFILRKHDWDDYVKAVLKLAYEMEFGEGSYHGS